MKLVVAVIQDADAQACSDALTAGGFVCTRVASHGAFLDTRNTTLLIGVDDVQVEEVIAVLRQHARRRVAALHSGLAVAAPLGPVVPSSVEVEVGGATVFVLPLERCEKL
ncbi:MAG: cyclic-di-AMP receptor [Candidatus Dormibacteria bacterium]